MYDVLYSLPYKTIELDVSEKFYPNKRLHSIRVDNVGSVDTYLVVYGDNKIPVQGWTFAVLFDTVYNEFVETTQFVTVEKSTTAGIVNIYPLMNIYQRLKLYREGKYMNVIVDNQIAIIDPNGIYEIYTMDTIVYTRDGSTITVNECLESVFNCVFLVGDVNVLNMVAIKVTPIVVATVREDVWQYWNPQGNVFRVYVPTLMSDEVAYLSINKTSFFVNQTMVRYRSFHY